MEEDKFFENEFCLEPFFVCEQGFVFGIDYVVIFVEICFGAVVGSEM